MISKDSRQNYKQTFSLIGITILAQYLLKTLPFIVNLKTLSAINGTELSAVYRPE